MTSSIQAQNIIESHMNGSDTESQVLINELDKSIFDERIQTSISLAIESSNNNEISSITEADNNPVEQNADFVVWRPAKKIADAINNQALLNAYGGPTKMEICGFYLAIATTKGFILLFDFHQKLALVLQRPLQESAEESIDITVMSFSSDGTSIAAGCSTGDIFIWNIGKDALKEDKLVLPSFSIWAAHLKHINQKERRHERGRAITFLGFIGSSNSKFLSADTSGLLYYHYSFRSFLQIHMQTHLIEKSIEFGNTTQNGGYKYKLLPLGSSVEITDMIGMLAIINNHYLEIVSILSLNDGSSIRFTSHYKYKKPKLQRKERTSDFELDWYPCMINSGKKSNARLAFSWGSSIFTLEICNDLIPVSFLKFAQALKNKDKVLFPIPIKLSKQIAFPDADSVMNIKWTSSSTLLVFLRKEVPKESTIEFLHYENGAISNVCSQTLNSKKLNVGNLSSSVSSVIDSDLATDLIVKVFKGNLFMLHTLDGSYRLYHGKKVNWAHNILKLILHRKYTDAVLLIYEYYHISDLGKVSLFGLEQDFAKRHAVLAPSLLKTMGESIPYVFKTDKLTIRKTLKKYSEIYSDIFKEFKHVASDISSQLERIFDVVDNDALFFDILEPFFIMSYLPSPPPNVLKSLVKYYTSLGEGDTLTEMLCQVDISLLDIDFTVRLCEQYNLRECLVYITNLLLHDYSGPLISFLSDIKNSATSGRQDLDKVYLYLSYILTGRQYPVERPIEVEYMEHARKSVLSIIFDGNNFDSGEDSIFPALHVLLKYNSSKMFTTFNEFFEDSSLNDEEHILITRQYIIEAFLDDYCLHDDEFTFLDRLGLCIFIARNYPKYSQFIRLSETTLENVVETICSNTEESYKENCELALQCFFSVYDPVEDAEVVVKIQNAGFFNVLVNLYHSKGNFIKILEIWLDQYGESPSKVLFSSFSYSRVLEEAFLAPGSKIERIKLRNFLRANFKELAMMDLMTFTSLVSKYEPEIHKQLETIEDVEFNYKYLEFITQNSKLEEYTLRSSPMIVFHYTNALLDLHPEIAFKILKKYIHILYEQSNVVLKMKELLKKAKRPDMIYLMLLHEKQTKAAFDVLIEKLDEIALDLISVKSTDFNLFDYYYNLTTSCCQEMDLANGTDMQLNELNENMWLELITHCVRYSNSCTATSEPTANNVDELMEFYDRHVQISFKNISSSKLSTNSTNKSQMERSFIRIFNKFLEGSDAKSPNSHVTLLYNIKNILKEVFISYSYESETLELSMTKLNRTIRKLVDGLLADKRLGWDISNVVCSSCGKKLSGSDIPACNYYAWEEQRKNSILVQQNKGIQKFSESYDSCTLVLFKCGHYYHQDCLSKLGAKKISSCILCAAELERKEQEK